MKSYWSSACPSSNMSGIFTKMGNLDTDRNTGRTSYEDKGRDWGDASTSQGMPKIACKLRSYGRHEQIFSHSLVRGSWGLEGQPVQCKLLLLLLEMLPEKERKGDQHPGFPFPPALLCLSRASCELNWALGQLANGVRKTSFSMDLLKIYFLSRKQ